MRARLQEWVHRCSGNLAELEFAVLEPAGEFSFVRLDRNQSKPQGHKAE